MSINLTIYTTTNWLLIKCLWPNGASIGPDYMVSTTDITTSSIAKLNNISPYLADSISKILVNNTNTFYVTFIANCATSIAKEHWPLAK